MGLKKILAARVRLAARLPTIVILRAPCARRAVFVAGSATLNITSGSRMLTSTSSPAARSTTLHGSRRPIERSTESASCASFGLQAPRIR